MDTLLRVLTLAQKRLDEANIKNAVIGGLAVSAWGRPRLTDDVDLKVDASRSDVARLIEILKPDFRPIQDAAEHARSLGVLFLDGPEGVRLDLLLADLGFDEHALERALTAEILPGFSARLCTPEDVILYKMITTRSRDREDVQSIVAEQGKSLDRNYVERWLKLFEEALDDSTLIEAFRKF